MCEDLSSDLGVDYTNLQNFLRDGNWREADYETRRVMYQASRREKEVWLRDEDIDRFPCTDFRTIDQLWVKYSNGRFGFSVQKRIFLEVGGTPGILDGKTWEKFCDRVSWRVNNQWLWYFNLTFCAEAPEGHLPTVFCELKEYEGIYDYVEGEWRRIGSRWRLGIISSLAQRLVTCRI